MVSVKVTVMAFALLTVCLLVTNTSAAGYRGCCQRYMTGRVPFPLIKGYAVQTMGEMCNMNAIIFYTKKGQTCANPALNWVMDSINRLRNKAQRVHVESSKAQK